MCCSMKDDFPIKDMYKSTAFFKKLQWDMFHWVNTVRFTLLCYEDKQKTWLY